MSGVYNLLSKDLNAAKDRIKELEVELEKANERVEKLTERCKPSKIVMINGAGHYVSETVYKEIEQLRKEQG